VKAGQRHPVDARMPSALSQEPPAKISSDDYFTAKSLTFVPATSVVLSLALTPGDEN
jgi:hypothetical protein